MYAVKDGGSDIEIMMENFMSSFNSIKSLSGFKSIFIIDYALLFFDTVKT